MKRFAFALVVVAVVTAAALAFRGQGQPEGRAGGRGNRGGDGPVPVLVAETRRTDVPVKLEAVGTVQALNTVTVRPQVDGRLVELAFRDGQDVKKGDVLARIEPSIYQAQLDQALAKKAQTEAQLANARLDLDRQTHLQQTQSGSRQQYDTQRAQVAQFDAQTRSDQAAIDNARAVLEYATIRSPINGRTGIRMVDQGNIIRQSDAVVVLTQLKPISVYFNLPQQHLRAVTGAMAKRSLVVEALESDNRTVLDRGTLEVVDNQVDPATGTVRLKAQFQNADLQLWPGQFVNVRLFVDMLQNVVVVPSGAVQRGPNGAYVYVVGEESKVAMRPVTVASQDEAQAVVAQGVAPPDPVVTSGFARLKDGDAVKVTQADRPDRPGRREGARPGPDAGGQAPPGPEAQATAPAAAPQGATAPEGARARQPEADWGKRRRRQEGGATQ